LKHTVHVIRDAQAQQSYLLYHMGTGSCLPKTTIEPKLAADWVRGASEKFWGTPTYFCNHSR